MNKFKIPLTRPERAFIFFTAQSFKPDLPFAESGSLEGLRLMYSSILKNISLKNWELFNAEAVNIKFTIPEICAIYQMTFDSSEYVTAADAITAARSIIWKTHKIIMAQEL
jgi:hypothetical protein